jgi:hypothetical protein
MAKIATLFSFKKLHILIIIPFFIGIITYASLTFLGLYYVTAGNAKISSLGAFLISGLTSMLSLYLLSLKERRKPLKKALFLILYIVVAFIVSIPILYFLEVETIKKEAIRKLGFAKLDDVKKLRSEYYAAIEKKAEQTETGIKQHLEVYLLQPNNKDAHLIDSLLLSDKEDVLQLTEYANSTPSRKETLKPSIRSLCDTLILKNNQAFKAKCYGVFTVDDSVYLADAAISFTDWQILNVLKYYTELDARFNSKYAGIQNALPDFVFNGKTNNQLNLSDKIQIIREEDIQEKMILNTAMLLMHVLVLSPFIFKKTSNANLSNVRKSDYNNAGSLRNTIDNF